MTRKQLQQLRRQFAAYVDGFVMPGRTLPPFLQLKRDHSERVAGEALALAQALEWSPCEQTAAEALGLLHDVGRFSQYAEFGTFSDAASVDHGQRGWETVRQDGWLNGLEPLTAERIATGIRYHNRLTLPDEIPPAVMPWVACIRDADKLDILNIVLEAVERDGFQELPDMLPGISLDRKASSAVLDSALQPGSGSLSQVRTLGDFLVMQMTWVYDINYAPTLVLIRERGLIPRLREQIESTPAVCRLGRHIEEHLRGCGTGYRSSTRGGYPHETRKGQKEIQP